MRVKAYAPLALFALLAISLASPVPATAQDPGTESVLSNNLQLLTTLPNPAVIGARFKGEVMFVTSATGVTAYDVSAPEAPALIGALPLPHFENEDVDLAGDILLVSNDAAESTGILHVIDISDPAAMSIRTSFPMGGNPVEGGPGHTASCVLQCKYVWVTDAAGIMVVDLTNPDAPQIIGSFDTPAGGDIATHDVQVDGNGLAWVVGFGGADAYRLPANYDGNGLGTLVTKTDESGMSTYLEEFGIGEGGNPNDFVLHNSFRKKGSPWVFITEEDYTRPTCKGAGSLGAWKVPLKKNGLPNGKDVKQIDSWATELLSEPPYYGVPPAAAVCSAHYFDLRGNVVAQGWYEQGLRLLDVSNPRDIRQIGYMVPPSAMTWAAYFPPTDPTGSVIYSFDASHGIDVLKLARPAKGPLSQPRKPCTNDACRRNNRARTVRAPVLEEWETSAGLGPGVERAPFGYACRLGAVTTG